MRFPPNYYWKDPLYGSAFTPYEKDFSDFFFSGHCGGITTCLVFLKYE